MQRAANNVNSDVICNPLLKIIAESICGAIAVEQGLIVADELGLYMVLIEVMRLCLMAIKGMPLVVCPYSQK